jgi:hypothetical protein
MAVAARFFAGENKTIDIEREAPRFTAGLQTDAACGQSGSALAPARDIRLTTGSGHH